MLVFTNGCFDIILRGYLELLKYCSSLGSKVVVGLNSDESVKKLKGSSRPINTQKDFPVSFLEIAKPIGWDYARDENGDQKKYPQSKIMEQEFGSFF